MRGDSFAHPALRNAVKKPDLNGHHERKEAGYPGWEQESFRHSREERQNAEAIYASQSQTVGPVKFGTTRTREGIAVAVLPLTK